MDSHAVEGRRSLVGKDDRTTEPPRIEGVRGARSLGVRARTSSPGLEALVGDPVRVEGVVVGATCGALRPNERELVVASLRRGDDPGDPAPGVPWSAAARRGDGSFVATASTMMPSGLFLSREQYPLGHVWNVATDPGSVVRARTAPTTLDEQYLIRFVALASDERSTPYREIHRVASGVTAIMRGGRLMESVWCGPDVWPAPFLEGADVPQRYRHVFDAALADAVERIGPMVSTLSGGLDSTFLVSSLARVTDRPIATMSHKPLSAAALAPQGSWDPDDSGIARAVAEACGSQVTFAAIENEHLVQSLDAADRASRASWVPSFNPSNQVWISDVHDRAAALGAAFVFHGTNGNATFSFDHDYAAAYYAGRGRMGGYARLLSTDATAESLRMAVSRDVLGPMRRALRPTRPYVEYRELIGLVAPIPDPGRTSPRRSYLQWMCAGGSSLPAALNTGLGHSVIDPFRTRQLLELAAAMTPAEWRSAGPHRGYARLLGEGRVPDVARLRRRRGGQSWDSWYWIRNERDRYLAEVDLLARTPALHAALDVAKLRGTVQTWPWGAVHGPARIEVLAVERVLSLAQFARMTQERLRATH